MRAVELCQRWGVVLVRTTLGLVYIWFGALKLTNDTPVADLVRDVIPFATPAWFVPVVGAVEVAIGVWFLAGRALLYLAPVFGAHMAGTFGVLLFLPGQAFIHGHVWELTMTGEFVVKNLVLLAAGLLVCTSCPASTRTEVPAASALRPTADPAL
ncbi:hypothetical protein [Streptomyces sp. NPDC001401]|uniref:hypothetical protein n=1 Tax=Streptomyces sp. NPDC001401 TaxID=3364570 RepID=UPI0036991425